MASDGKWYPPHDHPSVTQAPPAPYGQPLSETAAPVPGTPPAYPVAPAYGAPSGLPDRPWLRRSAGLRGTPRLPTAGLRTAGLPRRPGLQRSGRLRGTAGIPAPGIPAARIPAGRRILTSGLRTAGLRDTRIEHPHRPGPAPAAVPVVEATDRHHHRRPDPVLRLLGDHPRHRGRGAGRAHHHAAEQSARVGRDRSSAPSSCCRSCCRFPLRSTTGP